MIARALPAGLGLLFGSFTAHAEAPVATLEAPAQARVVVGEVVKLAVELRTAGRYQVAPVGVMVELTGPERGLGLRQRRYQRGDATAEEGEAPALGFSVAVRGELAGAYELGVRARFWACTPRLCMPVDQRRTIAIEVAPPSPPPPPPPAASEPTPAVPAPSPVRRRPRPTGSVQPAKP